MIVDRGWRILAGGVLVAASVAACAAPGPTLDVTRVLHLENRVSAAIIVSVGPRDGGQSYETAIRPCGGRLDLIVGREIPTGDDWLVFLSYDSSRAFDAALAGWTGDPHDLPGKYTVLPIWSRGDIRVADLPKWVTVTPDDTQIGTTPAAGTVVPPCGPLPTTPAGTIPLTVGFAE